MCLPNCPLCNQGEYSKKPIKQRAKSNPMNRPLTILTPVHGGAVITGIVKKRGYHPPSEAERKLFLETIYPL